MSSAREISYRVQQLGAEGVRQRIREINAELKAGKPVTRELKTEMSALNQQVGAQQRAIRLNEQAWKAQHTTWMAAGRVMSAVGSTARSLLSITTAFSVAFLAFGKTNRQLQESRMELEKLQSQLAEAIASGASIEEISEIQEAINKTTAQVKELESEEVQGAITNVINFGAAFALMGNQILEAAPKIASNLPGLINGLKGLGTTLGGFAVKNAKALAGIGLAATGGALLATGGIDALIGKSDKLEDKLKAIGGVGLIGVGIAVAVPEVAKFALIGTAIAAATVAILVFRKEIAGFFGAVGEFLAPAAEKLHNFFTADLPVWGGEALVWLSGTFSTGVEAVWLAIKTTAETIWGQIKSGFLSFWNGMVGIVNTAVNGILGGIESLANGFIAMINGMIEAYNEVARFLKLGALSTLATITLPRVSIPLIAAANGFNGEVRQPTLFLAGERGPEQVMITPRGRGSGGINVTVIVQGDVSGEELVDKVRMSIKDRLRYDRSFTGFE